MNLFGAMALGCLLLSCAGSKEIKVSGTVRNMQGKQIVYYQSIDGMYNSQSYDSLKVNPDSTYTLTFPAERHKRLRFFLLGEKVLGTVVVNKHKAEVNLDGNAELGIEVRGIDKKEMEAVALLDQLNSDVWDLRARRSDRWNVVDDTVATSVVAKLKADALAMDEKMKGVDEGLYKKLQQNVRMQLMLIFQEQLFVVNERCSDVTRQQWFEAWKQMRTFCSDNNPDSPFSLAFCDVAYNNAGIDYVAKGGEASEVGDLDELSFNYYEHNLSGKAQETAMAQLFLRDESEEQNNPAIIPLSESFKKLYPKSAWIPLVDRAVAKNKAFNKVETFDYIHFPDIENVKTFGEVIDRYKGKVVFMDIWATWCAPCRKSFAYIKPLQEYVKRHDDIVLLYLSIDRQKDDAKWHKMVASYGLMGEHIRIQDAFHSEIYKTFGDEHGVLSIPHYIIFDKSGKIHFNAAASPENMEELQSQLEEASGTNKR